MKMCGKCGNVVSDRAVKCDVCGAPLEGGNGANSAPKISKPQSIPTPVKTNAPTLNYGANQTGNSNFQTKNQPEINNFAPVNNQAATVKIHSNKFSILVVVVMGIILGTVFSLVYINSRPGNKLVNAIDKISKAESIDCEGTVSISSGSLKKDIGFEIQSYYDKGDEDSAQMSFKMDSLKMGLAFVDNKLYMKYGDNSQENDDKNIIGLMKAMCTHNKEDMYKYMSEISGKKVSDDDIEKSEEHYDKTMDFLKDSINKGNDCDFIEDFEKDGNTYSMSIDNKKFLEAYIKDSDVEFSKDEKKSLEEQAKNMSDSKLNLEYTVKSGKFTELTITQTVNSSGLLSSAAGSTKKSNNSKEDSSNAVTATIHLEFNNEKIDPEKSNAVDIKNSK